MHTVPSSPSQMNCSCLQWEWLLCTWWSNFPPPLIVAMEHTPVKHHHYCIRVYTHTLIRVDTSVWGNCRWLPSRWRLSSPPSHPLSHSHSLSHPHCFACHLPVLRVCAYTLVLTCVYSVIYLVVVASCKKQCKCDAAWTGSFCPRDRVTGCHACLKLQVASAHMDLNAAY